VHIPNGCDANGANCVELKNNIGFINTTVLGAFDPHVVVANNDPAAGPDQPCPPASDPRFVDPRVADYRLQADSPARNAGVVFPGVTDGSTDAVPSLGAYQYGAPRRVPGATAPSSEVSLHYAPRAVLSADSHWFNSHTAARPAHEASRTQLTTFNVSSPLGNSGPLRLGYRNPVDNPTDPMFANLDNLAIDKVEVRLFARAFNHSAAGRRRDHEHLAAQCRARHPGALRQPDGFSLRPDRNGGSSAAAQMTDSPVPGPTGRRTGPRRARTSDLG